MVSDGGASLDNIRIVLVNTTHPGNIGAVARAMKNMGLSQLYLVKPKRFPDEEAVFRSAHAVDILDNAVITETLDEALEGVGMIIGTSARERRIPWPLLNPREAADETVREASGHPVAILFGREDRGLTNEELQKCHRHLHIPTASEYSSLNVAAAVQVVCYEIRMALMGSALPSGKQYVSDMREWDVSPADTVMLEHFYEHLEKVLVEIDFMDPDNPRQTMPRLRRLFNRVRMDEMEVAMLRGILNAMEGKRKKNRRGKD